MININICKVWNNGNGKFLSSVTLSDSLLWLEGQLAPIHLEQYVML